MSSIIVSELITYPLKSAAGIALSTMTIARRGPANDRRWMVVDSDGQFLTQRQHPRMCLIATSLDEAGVLTLAAKHMQPLELPVEDVGVNDVAVNNVAVNNTVTVQIWNDSVEAQDCGDDAAQWMSNFLGVNCRVVYMPDNSERAVDANYAFNQEIVGFSDGFPLLLISQASLDDLNTRLSQPILMNRFRPNIVVTGCAAFAEDQWQCIRIGNIAFRVAKPCSRCVIPSIDPLSGEKQPAVVRTLAGYRRREGKVFFGQNLLHSSTGHITLKDAVEVVQ